jgi:hypothetical protein
MVRSALVKGMVQTKAETEIITFFTRAISEPNFALSLSSPVRGLKSLRIGAPPLPSPLQPSTSSPIQV